MIHVLFRLFSKHSELLVEHAGAYADLIGSEIALTQAHTTRQAVLWLGALCGACITVTLAGVGLLLWAALPRGQLDLPWVLMAVPCVPLVAALTCMRLALKKPSSRLFDNFRRQLQDDLQVLRESGTP